ncbi:UNVERIFIED_CONTAM: hypothetical protein FKN15_067514 [Acipenser sinensis]
MRIHDCAESQGVGTNCMTNDHSVLMVRINLGDFNLTKIDLVYAEKKEQKSPRTRRDVLSCTGNSGHPSVKRLLERRTEARSDRLSGCGGTAKSYDQEIDSEGDHSHAGFVSSQCLVTTGASELVGPEGHGPPTF